MPLNILSPSIKSFIAFALLVFSVSVSAQKPLPPPPAGTAPLALELDQPVERDLLPNEADHFRFSLAAGEYARVAVVQEGVSVLVSLFTEQGEKLIEAESQFNEKWVSALAARAANYRLEIRAARNQQAAAHYKARIEVKRAATKQDEERIVAEKIVAAASHYHSPLRKAALEQFNAALRIWRAIGDRWEEGRTLYLMGSMALTVKDHYESIEFLNQALAISQSTLDRSLQVKTLRMLGNRMFDIAESQKAIGFYTQSLQLSQRIPSRLDEAAALVNLGFIHSQLGDWRKAVEFHRLAGQIHQTLDNRMSAAMNQLYLGNALMELGETQPALAIFAKELELARKASDRPIEARCLNGLGLAYQAMGRYAEAEDCLRQALRFWRKIDYRPFYLMAMRNLGELYEKMGRLPEALRIYEQALKVENSVEDRNYEADVHRNIARIELARGNFAKAYDEIVGAISIAESMRAKIFNLRLRSDYFARKLEYYDLYIDLMMRQHHLDPFAGYDVEAFWAGERVRARSLLDSLNENLATAQQDLDPKLAAHAEQLRLQIEAREFERVKLARDNTAGQKKQELARQLLLLTSEYEQVQAQIKQRNPKFSVRQPAMTLGLAEVQRLLDPETMLLEYCLGRERSYLFAVTPNGLHSFTLPARTVIEQAARRFYAALTARGRTLKFEMKQERQARILQADAERKAAAALLSQMLLAPVQHLLGRKRLLIRADGALHYIPFGALPEPWREMGRERGRDGEMGRGGDGEIREESNPHKTLNPQSAIRNPQSAVPLVATHEIVNIPSASILSKLRQQAIGREAAAKWIAVFADPVFDSQDARLRLGAGKRNAKGDTPPAWAIASGLRAALEESFEETGEGSFDGRIERLPFTSREARSIMALAPRSASKLVSGFDANRLAASSAELGQYRYLHFATHSLLNNKHPDLSGLILSLVDTSGAEQDGFWRVLDIANQKLSAELVVLSGCRTGLGRDVSGEGLLGVTRGFLSAGATRVIMSLWDVDDEATARLMEHFYRALLVKRQSPAAALRAAQNAMARNSRWHAPYYWAGFVLQGEPR